MNYEIVDGVLFIYEQNRDVPFIKQPTWPCGDEWADGEAEAWAEQTILALTDPTADLAGPSRDYPTEKRPIYEEEEPTTLGIE
jgi:hypothetical protein